MIQSNDQFFSTLAKIGSPNVFGPTKRVRLTEEGVLVINQGETLRKGAPDGVDIWAVITNVGLKGTRVVFAGTPSNEEITNFLVTAQKANRSKKGDVSRMLVDVDGDLTVATLENGAKQVRVEKVASANRTSVTFVLDDKGALAFSGKFQGQEIEDLPVQPSGIIALE